jgi:hypothetical protein
MEIRQLALPALRVAYSREELRVWGPSLALRVSCMSRFITGFPNM